jgi:hypothetical protein
VNVDVDADAAVKQGKLRGKEARVKAMRAPWWDYVLLVFGLAMLLGYVRRRAVRASGLS